MGSISGIAASLLQQTVFQSGGPAGNNGISSTSSSGSSDKNQLSPLAQLLGDLQTLQKTDPAKYKDVTGQIAVKLQAAANAETAEGNLAGASQLTTLASDFTTASKTGQLPNFQEVVKALGGGHHHHHHGHSGGSPAPADQVQAAYQTDSGSSSSPLAILSSALSS